MSDTYHAGRAWRITALLAVFSLVNFLDKVVLGMVAVPMMHELSLTSAQFGTIAGSLYWLFAIAGVAGGFLADRIQARWLLLAMALMWSVVQIPVAVSSSVTVILIARVLLGIGEGPAAPVTNHACYKWFPNHRRNLPVTVINMGATTGILMAGVLIPQVTMHWGWRANFVILALIGLLWAGLWLAFGAEGPIDDGAVRGRADAGKLQHRVPYARLLADSSVIGIIVLHFAAFWGMALTLTWLPAYLQKGLGFDAITSGHWFALIVLVGAPIGIGVSWWSQRLLANGGTSRNARALVSGVALLTAGLLYCLPIGVDLGNVEKILLIAMASSLAPVIYALGPAMMSEVVPASQRGAMLAIENSVASTAGILAPVVTGKLIDTMAGGGPTGYEQAFAVSGILLISGAIIALLFIHPERSSRKFEAIPLGASAP
jgi:MFS family permease